jgi:hypothetical protein
LEINEKVSGAIIGGRFVCHSTETGYRPAEQKDWFISLPLTVQLLPYAAMLFEAACIVSAALKRNKTDGAQSSRSDSSKAEDASLVILGRKEPG